MPCLLPILFFIIEITYSQVNLVGTHIPYDVTITTAISALDVNDDGT